MPLTLLLLQCFDQLLIFLSSLFFFSGGSIKSYCATDQDVSDVLTFSILSGNDANTFLIDKDASNPLCFFIMMNSAGTLQFLLFFCGDCWEHVKTNFFELLFFAVNNDLNFEDPLKNSFNLVVQAQDNGAGNLVATVVTTIRVNNVNDLPVLSVMTSQVPENAKAGDPVGGSIVAIDEDVGDTLTYSIVSGNVCGVYSPVFSITSINSIGSVAIADSFNPTALSSAIPAGELQSCSASMPAPFVLSITVFDGNGGSDTTTLSITVKDKNDPPVFTNCLTTQNVVIDENVADNTNVGTLGLLAATDPDPGNTVTWVLLSQGNSGSAFGIVGGTGQLFVADMSMMDFESSNNPYLLTIDALDDIARLSGGATAKCTVRVTLQDVNEYPVLAPSYSRSVEENSVANIDVGAPIAASDVDAGPAGDLEWSLPANPPQFTIVGSTGQIKTGNTMIDFEADSSSRYEITVRVTDGGSPVLSVSSTVVISVIDKNDPPFMPVMSVNMDESSLAGTVVASSSLLGTDEDTTDNTVANPLTYTMVAHAGTTGVADLASATAKFEIFVASGAPVLRLKSSSTGLNYESVVSYVFNIQVSDNEFSTDSSLCTIHINNVNEIPTFTSVCSADSSHAYCFDVNENSLGGTNVGTIVSVQDEDVGQAQTFSIASSSPTASAFTVVASTGQLQVSSSLTRDLLDHELFSVGSAAEYLLQIASTDNGVLEIGGGLTKTVASLTSVTASVRITIADVNEPPVFPATPTSYPNRPSSFPETRWLSIDENSLNSVVLSGTVQATDPDDSTSVWGKLTYSNKYYITKVNENCGTSDKVIRSQSECIEALKFVGKSGQIMWSSQNTGIPGGCSVRDPDDGHFDTRGIQGTVGGKRSDLAAVCKTNAQLKSTCIVSVPHTQLKCQTSAGAGKGLKMVVTIGKLCTYFGFYLWLFGFVSWFLILLFLRHTHAHTTFYFIGGQKSTIPAISYGVPTLKTTTCGTTHGAINSGEPQCACGSSDLKTTKNPPLTCPHVNKKIPVITIGNLKCWHRSDKVNPCIALTNPLGLPTPIVGDVDSSTRLSTKGYQLIMLSGFNFGRTSDLESVTYGPFTGTEVSMNIVADGTSLEKSKGGCKIHEPSFSILCNTLPGIAGPHNWIVTVKGQVSQQLIKTRYASPIVSSVSPAQFPTSGNTKVVITGEEFGTADSAASFQVVFTNGGPVNHCKDSTGTLCKTIEATRMPTLAGNCVFVFGCFVEIL